jgi:drug/metabolite transporter (DMT)-like permease
MELPSTGAFLVALVVSISSSLLVFAHAERHGNRRATAWGVAAFVFALMGVVVYFGRYLWTQRRTR